MGIYNYISLPVFDLNSVLFLDQNKYHNEISSPPQIIIIHILKWWGKSRQKGNLLLNVQGPNNLNNLSIYLILSSEAINSP